MKLEEINENWKTKVGKEIDPATETRIEDIVHDLVRAAESWMVIEVDDYARMPDEEKIMEVDEQMDKFLEGRYDSARDQRFISRHRQEIVKRVSQRIGA